MSNTPLVKTTVFPSARSLAIKWTASVVVTAGWKLQVRRERPVMTRPVDADVVRPRLHAEGVQQPVVVVRSAVALVDGDVQLGRAFDQVEPFDRRRRLRVPCQARGIHLFEEGVRAVAAHAFGTENADAEHHLV